MRIQALFKNSGVVAFAALGAAIVASVTEAEGANRPRLQAAPEGPAFSRAVIAVVSIKDQRVSFYDANGVALRSHVSSGQIGLDTPSGVYSVLQKEAEHYSNVYDDAAMPFMQRITWSGIALHAGALPGYPASHGCVRMAYQFARNIFPLTRLGMRVVITPDDFAPVPISNPLLPQPAPPSDAVATSAAYTKGVANGLGASPFQPDVGNWPARQTQLDALRSDAAAKAVAADAATAKAAELKRVFDKKTVEQAKAKKAHLAATRYKRTADDQLFRASHALAVASVPRSTMKEQAAKEAALAASAAASDAVSAAKDKLAVADRELDAASAALNAEKPRSDEARVLKREVDKKKAARFTANKALAAANAAKRAANNRVAYAEKVLYLASVPPSTKYQEAAKAKALAVSQDADAKAIAATAAAEKVNAEFAAAEKGYKDAEAYRVGAVEASQRAMRRTLPVSIFVSLKSQHLYVRQGHEPVVDMPVAIADPKKPIGTHVYTAVDYADEGASLRWTAITIGHNAALGNKRRNRWASLDVAAPPTDVTDAAAALDRITMPEAINKRLAGYVWPGSSMIVSDEEMSSKETGKATDFVVLLSGEPQGGLKSRPKSKAPSRRRARDYDDYDDDRRSSRRYRQPPTSTFFFW